MRVFLDTNIIIDLIQKREDYELAARIFQGSEDGEYELCTSTLSMVNVAYILRKFYKGYRFYELLGELMEIINVVSVSSLAYGNALKSKAGDFEDAVQLFSALEEGVDYIITRNVDDFIDGLLPICTPSVFLENYRL